MGPWPQLQGIQASKCESLDRVSVAIAKVIKKTEMMKSLSAFVDPFEEKAIKDDMNWKWEEEAVEGNWIELMVFLLLIGELIVIGV